MSVLNFNSAAITNNIDKSNTVAGAHVTAALQVDGTALDTTIGYPLTTNIKVTLTLTLNEGNSFYFIVTLLAFKAYPK